MKLRVWTPTGPRIVAAKEQWATRCPGCIARAKSRGLAPAVWAPFIPPEYDVCDQCVLDEAGLGHAGQHDSGDQLGLGSLRYKEDAVLVALRDLRWKLQQAAR